MPIPLLIHASRGLPVPLLIHASWGLPVPHLSTSRRVEAVDAHERSERPEPEVLAPEVVEVAAEADDEINETIDHPAKVMRIGTMLKQLLGEVRSTELDEASRQRLREIYETSVGEVGSALSADLREELTRLASPFDGPEAPSAVELQIAKAQLVGWLEGLIQGMKAMLLAQQMTAHQQLQAMRGELPPGAHPHQGSHHASDTSSPHGTYL